MKPPSEDIKDILVAGLIATYATDLFIGIMPDKPDANIAVRDLPSSPPELNYEYEYPLVQVTVRGKKGSYLVTYGEAQDVNTTLHGQTNLVVNATRYALIRALHSPAYLGVDKLNRPLFSINFEVQRTTA